MLKPEGGLFSGEQLNKLFPFFLHITGGGVIKAAGKSLRKIAGIETPLMFNDVFRIKRPFVEEFSAKYFTQISDQLVIIEDISDPRLVLRGQFEKSAYDDTWFFLGSPWFGSMEQVAERGLSIHDFAYHDAMVDLLHVLKTQEITNDELKELLHKLNAQKKQLSVSENNYRMLVEKATDIIYKIDLNGSFRYVNPVAIRLTGFKEEELMEMSYTDLIRDDYKPSVVRFYTEQVVHRLQTTYLEFPIVTKTGEERWVGQSVQFPQINNEAEELFALAIDITDKKKYEKQLVLQEEKYRNIIENINLGLLEVDRNDTVQYANQSFYAMSGFTEEELLGKSASALLLNDHGQEVLKEKTKSRESGESDFYELPVRTASGETRWWMISGAPRYNDKGELVGSVGIHLDVTDRKRFENELKESRKKAEESSKAKEAFLATMSHEIRTPLNAIIGITDLMRMKNQQPENRENLEILSFSANNLLSLITDILDFSKIDAGKIEFARAEFDLQHLLNGTFHSFKSRCEEKQVALQLNIDKNIPPVLIGDELRLAQVLNNLLGNAVKFTSAGQIILHAGFEFINPRKIRLKFEVKDTGIGIKREKLDHIFDEFVQADARIVKDFGGSGLGLSITRKLIQLQGGDIHVSSRYGKGTSFTFFLDYEVSEKQQLQRKYEVIKETEKVFHPGLRILLVEDNLANQKVAVSYFDHWGLNADVANNGAEALQFLREQPYDLVLTDLFMPVMDGFETITKIRQQLKRKALPIIALTASAETRLIEKALKAGANRCLTKPFNPKELQQTLIELLHQDSAPKPEHVPMRVVSSSYSPEMKLKHIKLKRIEEASLGKPAFVREMLQICKSEIPQTLQQAQHYFNDANYTHFAKSIHKLKNTLLMIGLDEWSSHLQFMENSALAETQLSMVKLFLDELMVTGQEVVEELEQVIPTI